ncbi:MAG: alpha/beta hydrolase [Chloroflexota bacterium]|nr:alpha/beta hydrolase [Chloroflexota bacterium]
MSTTGVQVRRGFVLGPDGHIEYREAGPQRETGKPPLLLLHALPQSSRMYLPHFERLCEERRTVAWTMPGCGDSDRPPTPYTSLDEFAQAAVWLLDGLGIERTDLFATHTGSAVAIALASSHPDRVGSMVVQEPFNYGETEAGHERLHRAHHFAPLQADGGHLLEIWRRHGGEEPGANLYRVMDTVVEHLKLNSDEGVQELYGDTGWEGAAPYGMLRFDYWAALPRITARTLILHGSGSPLAEQHDRFVEGIPDATGMRPASETLLNINDDPERFARILLDFLEA